MASSQNSSKRQATKEALRQRKFERYRAAYLVHLKQVSGKRKTPLANKIGMHKSQKLRDTGQGCGRRTEGAGNCQRDSAAGTECGEDRRGRGSTRG
jgi:hypothetical protein